MILKPVLGPRLVTQLRLSQIRLQLRSAHTLRARSDLAGTLFQQTVASKISLSLLSSLSTSIVGMGSNNSFKPKPLRGSA
jgi:hypothetical protein